MAKPSIYIPDELYEEFDERVTEMRLSQEIDIDTSRSQVIQQLIQQWLEGNLNLTSNRCKKPTKTTAD